MTVYLISKYVRPFTSYLIVSTGGFSLHLIQRTMAILKIKQLTRPRAADPLFAMAIGSSAAYVRIRREQQTQHPERAGEIGYRDIVSTGAGRVRRWWAGDFAGL